MNSVALPAAIVMFVLSAPGIAGAANKEHQQLMAEIRMLQEQQQQLQQMIGGLADTLKTMTAKMDSQATTVQKAFADQNLVLTSVGDGVRVLREKADDTNVRLSTMTQEVQSMRQSIASMPAPQPATPLGMDPMTNPGGGATTAAPSGGANPPPSNISPTRMYDQSYADYTAGQFDLAAEGFQAFIRTFPTSPQADEAQLYIGYSLYGAGKNNEALAALQKVISDYPQSNSVSSAWYKLGLTYEALKQLDPARKAFETVTKSYPSSSDAILAQQALERLKKRDDE